MSAVEEVPMIAVSTSLLDQLMEHDVGVLLAALPQDGTRTSNRRVREKLGWTMDRYFQVRNEVRRRGRVGVGPGRGGTLWLIDEADAVRYEEEGSPAPVRQLRPAKADTVPYMLRRAAKRIEQLESEIKYRNEREARRAERDLAVKELRTAKGVSEAYSLLRRCIQLTDVISRDGETVRIKTAMAAMAMHLYNAEDSCEHALIASRQNKPPEEEDA